MSNNYFLRFGFALVISIGLSLLTNDVAAQDMDEFDPRGIYFNRFSGVITGSEWFQINAISGTDRFSLSDIFGSDFTGTITADGVITLDGGLGSGRFSGPDNFTITPNIGGRSFTFVNNRAAFTTAAFPLQLDSIRPVNPLLAGVWTNSFQVLDPATGTTGNINIEQIQLTVVNNALRITGPGGAFFQGIFENGSTVVFRRITPDPDGGFVSFPSSAIDFGPQDLLGEVVFSDPNNFEGVFLLQTQVPFGSQFQQLLRFTATRTVPIATRDVNGDQQVNEADRILIEDQLGLNIEDDDYNLLADIDNNELVDLRDSNFFDGQTTALMPINDGHAGSWFNTERSGEGWNVSILPGGDLALINFFSYASDGSTQAWVVGVGDIVGNEIQFRDLDLTSGTAFGDAFDPNDVIRSQWGDLSLHFIDCMNGEISYSATADFGNDARPIQRLTALAGVDCSQPGIPQTAEPSQIVTGSWFELARDGEGLVMEGLSNNLVVMYFYTYDLEGGTQYWLNGVGNFDPATNTATFDTLFTTTGGQFGDNFDADSISLIPWGSATFQQTGCGSAVFSYDSIIEGFGSNSYNVGRISFNNGISCNPDQFGQ